MKRVMVVSLAAIGLAAFGAHGQEGNGDGGVFATANLGYDVVGGGFAAGGGVGMEFSDLEAGLVALYGNGSTEYSEDEYQGTWDWEMFVLGLRVNWVYSGLFPDPSLFPILGTGFFYMSYGYTDTYTSDPYPDGQESDEVGAGGTLFNFGLGYALSEQIDVRFEVPVMVFFGDFGRVAVAIPLLAGVGVHF